MRVMPTPTTGSAANSAAAFFLAARACSNVEVFGVAMIDPSFIAAGEADLKRADFLLVPRGRPLAQPADEANIDLVLRLLGNLLHLLPSISSSRWQRTAR